MIIDDLLAVFDKDLIRNYEERNLKGQSLVTINNEHYGTQSSIWRETEEARNFTWRTIFWFAFSEILNLIVAPNLWWISVAVFAVFLIVRHIYKRPDRETLREDEEKQAERRMILSNFRQAVNSLDFPKGIVPNPRTEDVIREHLVSLARDLHKDMEGKDTLMAHGKFLTAVKAAKKFGDFDEKGLYHAGYCSLTRSSV